MKLKSIFYFLAFFSITAWGPFDYIFNANNPEAFQTSFSTSQWIESEAQILRRQASNLDPTVLKLALKAYTRVRERGYDAKKLLTIIDYSKPSSEKRLWVINLNNNDVMYNTWVAHGKNSGELNATSFSNSFGSLKSSLGVFVTDEPYFGKDGYSLRLSGLERGINDNSYRRSIVMHGAWYVDPSVAEQYGEMGRSWGCPAVNERLAGPIINKIRGKTILFAYYPDRHWLRNSPYING